MLNKYFIHNQFIKIKYKTILNEKNNTVQGIDMIQIKKEHKYCNNVQCGLSL